MSNAIDGRSARTKAARFAITSSYSFVRHKKSLVRNRGKSAEELGLGEVIRFARGRGGLAPREIERISG